MPQRFVHRLLPTRQSKSVVMPVNSTETSARQAHAHCRSRFQPEPVLLPAFAGLRNGERQAVEPRYRHPRPFVVIVIVGRRLRIWRRLDRRSSRRGHHGGERHGIRGASTVSPEVIVYVVSTSPVGSVERARRVTRDDEIPGAHRRLCRSRATCRPSRRDHRPQPWGLLPCAVGSSCSPAGAASTGGRTGTRSKPARRTYVTLSSPSEWPFSRTAA